MERPGPSDRPVKFGPPGPTFPNALALLRLTVRLFSASRTLRMVCRQAHPAVPSPGPMGPPA